MCDFEYTNPTVCKSSMYTGICGTTSAPHDDDDDTTTSMGTNLGVGPATHEYAGTMGTRCAKL